MIPVVDLFAGPGGLGEGFSSVTDASGHPAYDVALSIEMEPHAFATLTLRAFFRQFHKHVPEEYYQHLRGKITRDELFDQFPAEAAAARAHCWHAKLGPESDGGVAVRDVRKRIDAVVDRDEPWVLIGGPPCQAYSLAGRSRNRGNPNYRPDQDVRQRLYVEYLQILADHSPSVFIMENVKGLVSATLGNEEMFLRILQDLRDPGAALSREGRSWRRDQRSHYTIHSLVKPAIEDDRDVDAVVIRAEQYGIPQARHRVILLGVRDDYPGVVPKMLRAQDEVSLSRVISSLPRLRSGMTGKENSPQNWRNSLHSQQRKRWSGVGARRAGGADLSDHIRSLLPRVRVPKADQGGEFIAGDFRPEYAPRWYHDPRLHGICNHRTRRHMESDLFRYFYAACYAQIHGKSPTLREFPTDLLPRHRSVGAALAHGGNHSDRFRVQVADRPSTTIVSHISHDGHYYIHPDPLQCRSFTVREAARLQTFPDNYFFCGPVTAQYTQVGNAVPPLLARQVAQIVQDILAQIGARS